MNLAALHYWHWLLLSVLVGVSLGYAMRVTPGDLPSYGNSLNSQLQFEAALVEQIGDDRRFKDVVVRRCSIPGSAAVDIVSGLYCTGQLDATDQAYHWKPTFFVAAVPYRPASPIAGAVDMNPLTDPVMPDVCTFLSAMGVPFVHAWWRSRSMATCMITSLVMIGMVWPTLVTRIAYGRWTRPKDQTGNSLWRARTSPVAATSSTIQSYAAPREEPSADRAPPIPVADPMLPGLPVTPLMAGPLPPALAVKAEHKEFGAKPDDFYPTAKQGQSH
jgi:hypothetical protein